MHQGIVRPSQPGSHSIGQAGKSGDYQVDPGLATIRGVVKDCRPPRTTYFLTMPNQLSKPYCESVLRVEVPVVVTLAHKTMQIDQVLRLVPGVMIQFDKTCDSPMTVEICEQPVAHGEIVKIGDKFGIRIGGILKPAERFVALTEPAGTGT